jgi:hypothetical protein
MQPELFGYHKTRKIATVPNKPFRGDDGQYGNRKNFFPLADLIKLVQYLNSNPNMLNS